MKRIFYTSLFFLYACAADPFTAGESLSFPDAANIDVQNSNSDTNLTSENNSVDAGADQSNLPDQLAVSEKDANVEISFADVQTSETTEESHDAGPCIPKTCLTLAAETGRMSACGLNWDGCGNYIQCPNCDTVGNPHVSCGGGDVNSDGTVMLGAAGYCGGECVKSSIPSDTTRCTTTSNKYIVPWICSDMSANPPKGFGPASCVEINGEVSPFHTLTNKWCCL